MCLATIGLIVLGVIALEGFAIAVIWYRDSKWMKERNSIVNLLEKRFNNDRET